MRYFRSADFGQEEGKRVRIGNYNNSGERFCERIGKGEKESILGQIEEGEDNIKNVENVY